VDPFEEPPLDLGQRLEVPRSESVHGLEDGIGDGLTGINCSTHSRAGLVELVATYRWMALAVHASSCPMRAAVSARAR
jgi:hypothetical protein